MFKQWLTVEDIVRLDSSCCEHSQRVTYLDLISKALSPRTLHAGKDLDQYVRWFADRNIYVSALTVDGRKLSDSFESNAHHSMKSLVQVSQLCVNDVKREGNTINWLNSVAKFCSNVLSIDVFIVEAISVEWMQCILSNNAPHLKVITVFNSDESELLAPLAGSLAKCVSLEKLHMYNGENLCLDTLMLNCSCLRHVRLHGCGAMTDTGFARLLSLPMVGEIDLSTNNNITGTGEWNITTTKLELIWLGQFPKLTEENLVRIIRAVPNKAILAVDLFDMPDLSKYGDFGLKSFAQWKPKQNQAV